ncbi:type II toxin-antitoxin system VapC family toxin [Fimbriimonas ginsengisoli]|uniref:PilT protein domain protein n=1 Tax=Fimbriimonas ginsengisoli Gsoil 348 TaxID=661478 RepID=A0A068NXK1_FIMGI|nr:type II toxin-antitoxin system VapC family toxin [Fimbriimonas ginsengisoli]AIE86364.1 PilT protein domain protein [Fimbriimonas ginsengisoli Gsoil 348]
MTCLLDTQLLLWAAAGDRRLSTKALALIEDEANELFFSVVSLWEVVIKQSLNRDDFQVDARILRNRLQEHGYIELPVSANQVLAVARLPNIHRDPFDRLLIAQAGEERMTLLTPDPMIGRYAGNIELV